MSKPGTESTEKPRREKERERENRIPDLEWLFEGEGKKSPQKDNFIKKLFRRDWWTVLYTTFIYILQNSPVWILPIITSDVIDSITYMPAGYGWRLLIDGIIVFVVVALNVPTTTWRSGVFNRWVRTTASQIKSGVVRKLQRMSITYHKEMEEGRIQSKFLRDIDGVENYHACVIAVLVPQIVATVGSVAIALWKSPLVTLFFLMIIPLNVFLMKAFSKRMGRAYSTFRQENEKLSAKLTTTLQMMTLTKAHGLVLTEELAVGEKINSVKTAALKRDKTLSLFGAMLFVSKNLLSAVCLFFCAFLAIKGIISVGEVVLFQSLFASICASVMDLINAYPAFVSGKESVHSLSEIICAEDIERDDGKISVPGIVGEVTFEHVSYHYPNEEKAVVCDFHLHVKEGERIAVVGASGSGKSTVMNLLIGLLSPTEGRILIDGVPLTEMVLQEYRHFLSVVPQNSILFSGSIRDNITYGLSAYNEEDLARVVEDAAISEFLPSLTHGLDTPVGEHGDKLSGGQKQRVSIARALIRNPRILIMDEATSALDNVAEYHVQKAIERLVRGRTTFIVAHRLSTIRNADRIVVMEDGKMVEVGTYDELLALNGKFSELERLSRIREEEAEETTKEA